MAKRIPPLTEHKIDAAKATGKAYKLFDGRGLCLLVSPNGGKWWRFRYRFNGKEKMLSFGGYPKVSLNDARCCRDAAQELLMQGVDPSALRKEEKKLEDAERLEAAMLPSVRVTIGGKIEICKGDKIVRLSWDEARFVASLLGNILR